MKIKNISLLITSMLLLLLSACTKRPNPQYEVAMEEIDKTIIHFILLDENLEETTDTTAIVFNRYGEAQSEKLDLKAGGNYKMLLALSYQDESVNEEIEEEGEEHQFFFWSVPADLMRSFEYLDEDEEENPIGLVNQIGFSDHEGEGKFHIVLRHGLDKNHATIADGNTSNFRDAGGSDDLNLVFDFGLVE